MKFMKTIATSLLTAGIVATSLLTGSVAHAATVDLSGATKDYNNNAVVYGGASNVSELQSKYSASSSVATIYTHFGITAAEVQAMGSTAVAGSVTKTGNVLVGNTVVATGALTAGRQNITGSTKVTESGVTFYTRKPSVSFSNSSLPAFVVMKDGVFQFAILAACGNPVIATPPKTPKPPVTPPTTPKTPETPITTVSVSTPAALPNTGPGQIVAIAAGATVLGSIVYYLVAKRRLSL
jgi:hypothetical protein